jgi:excinuclease ABC subunit A
VNQLILAFHRLRDAGHTVLVVEHQMDLVAASDWVIDLGPGGGVHGGSIVAEGKPEDISAISLSATGRALASWKKGV